MVGQGSQKTGTVHSVIFILAVSWRGVVEGTGGRSRTTVVICRWLGGVGGGGGGEEGKHCIFGRVQIDWY